MDKSTIIIRLIPGCTFFLEGLQKFVYPDALGVGRFMHIGIPHAAFWAPATGATEMLFGLLLIIGLFTRLATIPLLIIMAVAFVYTKWPLLIEKGFLPMFHEYRTDFAMTLSLIFLLISGGGRWSVDHVRKKQAG